MIGMFVSTLPYRIQLDPHWSFDELVEHVREKCLSILQHSHYPLQHILADFHLNQSNVPFLETMFDFITVTSDVDHLCLNGTNLQSVSVEGLYEVARFDFMLTFNYNSASKNDRLSCHFQCSHDLLDETTVSIITRRFKYLLEQLFSLNSSVNRSGTCHAGISKFDLILPEEFNEMEDIIFCRQSNVMNEGMFFFN